MTAELAIGIPALLLVAALALGAIRWGIDAVAATSVAAEVARAIARGEAVDSALSDATSAVPTATWSSENQGLGAAGIEGGGPLGGGSGMVCVAALLPAPVPLSKQVTVEQCAPR